MSTGSGKPSTKERGNKMQHSREELVALAKSVTELAIQEKMINVGSDSESTAKEVASFYNAFLDAVKKN